MKCIMVRSLIGIPKPPNEVYVDFHGTHFVSEREVADKGERIADTGS